MLTMAANAVIDEKRSPDYWAVEKQWLAGEYESIVQHKMNAVRNKMKIDN
jgi:2-polyprenyl-3-methyl-5-hydroxy-6-metoxy-1,4-benzoquinol methylase